MTQQRDNRGFTLVELLVAGGIAVLIFSIGFTLIHGVIRSRSITQARLTASSNASLLFRLIGRDLRTMTPGPFAALNTKSGLRVRDQAGVVGDVLQMSTTNVDYTWSQLEAFRVKYHALRGVDLDLNAGLALSSVRYYATPNADGTGLLHREASLLQPGGGQDVFVRDDPARDMDYALFDRVQDLRVDFYDMTLDSDHPDFKKPLPPARIAEATHLDVRVLFLDANERLRLEDRRQDFTRLYPISSQYP